MRWSLIILAVILAATFPQPTLSVLSEPLVWAFGGGIAVGVRGAKLGRWWR